MRNAHDVLLLLQCDRVDCLHACCLRNTRCCLFRIPCWRRSNLFFIIRIFGEILFRMRSFFFFFSNQLLLCGDGLQILCVFRYIMLESRREVAVWQLHTVLLVFSFYPARVRRLFLHFPSNCHCKFSDNFSNSCVIPFLMSLLLIRLNTVPVAF